MAKMIQNTPSKETTLESLIEAIYEAVLSVDMLVSLLHKDIHQVYFSDAIIYLKHIKNLSEVLSATFVISTKVAVWADEKGTKEYLKSLGDSYGNKKN
jgi:hypothetical protein